MPLVDDELARYAQQIKLTSMGVDGQIKLKQARVLCVGAGGLASPLLLYLAAAGVGSLGIMDDDVIEVSNLQRQILFTTQDVGHKKASQAKHNLSKLNPHVDVTIYPYRMKAANAQKIISEYDIVADCSDNFATRYIINDACFQLNKPFVFASIHQLSGQCSTFYRQKNSCFRCLFPIAPSVEALPNCDIGGVLGVLPGLLGVIQATEILKYIVGIGDLLIGRLLCIDIGTMQWTEFKLSQNPDCALCVHNNHNNYNKVNDIGEEISVFELRHQLQGCAPIFLLDVRTMKEHEAFNIGGKLIPLQELPQRLSELNRHDDIVIYCHLGQRSVSALEILKKAHFHRVRTLDGGLRAWRNQSF